MIHKDLYKVLQVRITELEAQLAKAKEDAEILEWIIDNASSTGGGNGFTLKVFVPVDCECARTAMATAIAEGKQA